MFMIRLTYVLKVFEKGGLLLYRAASCVQGMLPNLTKAIDIYFIASYQETNDFLVHVTKL